MTSPGFREVSMHKRSDKEIPIDLTGYALIVYQEDNQPYLLLIENVHFLPVFSTIEKAYECLAFAPPDRPIKPMRIDDGYEFLDSVQGQVRVAIDPYIIDGKTRWLEPKNVTRFQ
jgi:hypothetical protein